MMTPGQAGIIGTYGHPTQVPTIDSSFKSLQQVGTAFRLCQAPIGESHCGPLRMWSKAMPSPLDNYSL